MSPMRQTRAVHFLAVLRISHISTILASLSAAKET
jgi:hypothetical protein